MSNSRLIPPDKVWKFTFEVSHAPHYVRQFANGTYMGIYAPDENVDRDTAVPFGISEESVRENLHDDHVTVEEVFRSETPWSDDAFLDGD